MLLVELDGLDAVFGLADDVVLLFENLTEEAAHKLGVVCDQDVHL